MEHQEAIRLRAVEKYLLDELEPAQRLEFEEHFFGCPECATDLRMTSEFLDIARKELGRGTIGGITPRTLNRSWIELLWSPAVLVPALALLLGIIAWQNFVVLPRFNGEIARLRRPGVVTVISLIGGNSRAVTSQVPSGSAGQPVLLSFDIPAAQQYSGYVCVLVDSSGTVVLRVPVSSAQAQDTVSISVPAGHLGPGDYVLIVQGRDLQGLHPQGQSAGAGTRVTDLARYRFNLTPSTNH